MSKLAVIPIKTWSYTVPFCWEGLKVLSISFLSFKFFMPQFKTLGTLELIYYDSHYLSIKLLYVNPDILLLQDQSSFFRLAAGALILVLLPVFQLFLYLVQRYHFYIFKCDLTIQGFTPIFHDAISQVVVMWRVEPKSFVGSQKLDGNQNHHDW